MGRLGLWDFLLLGLLVSPIATGSVFMYSMWGLLTLEVVPADQADIPTPHAGDHLEVYGTWVRDTGHLVRDYGWNEVHPVFFLRNLDTGSEGGSLQCRLLENVHNPERLRILDSAEPCKWARGRVEFTFYFGDGDLHIDLRLDPEYQYLANTGPPIVAISYPEALLLVGVTTASCTLSYVGVSLVRPQKTVLGKLILRLTGKS